jgi:hypothetical protein
MRVLSLLKRYWFYGLFWLAGLWLFWLATPIRPIVASTVSSGEYPWGFIDGGKSFVTVGPGNHHAPPYEGPILVRNTESGAVERSLFSRDDRFIEVFLNEKKSLLVAHRDLGPKEEDPRFGFESFDLKTGAHLSTIKRIGDPHTGTEMPFTNLSSDGRFIVFHTLIGSEMQWVCYEVATGRELIPNRTGYSYFSPDGRFVYLHHQVKTPNAEWSEIDSIINLDSKKEVKISPKIIPELFQECWPSPDGRFLLINNGEIWDALKGKLKGTISDSSLRDHSFATARWAHDSSAICSSGGNLWDIETGKLLSTIPLTKGQGGYFSGGEFSVDNKEFITPLIDRDGIWLVHYDIHSGQEVANKRILVFPSVDVKSNVFVYSFDGRHFTMEGRDLRLGYLQEIFLRIKNFLTGKKTTDVHTYGEAIVDAETQKIISDSEGHITAFWPDIPYVFIESKNDSEEGSGIYECWNVPPRKALGAFLYVAAIWFIGCAFLRAGFCLRSLRKQRAS